MFFHVDFEEGDGLALGKLAAHRPTTNSKKNVRKKHEYKTIHKGGSTRQARKHTGHITSKQIQPSRHRTFVCTCAYMDGFVVDGSVGVLESNSHGGIGLPGLLTRHGGEVEIHALLAATSIQRRGQGREGTGTRRCVCVLAKLYCVLAKLYCV